MSAGFHTTYDRSALRGAPATPAPARHPGFRPDIQGLRAIAVGLVVLHHFTGWPVGGFIGVDVFFVISGYLISDLLLRELNLSGRVSLREFYARRMRRIFPMAVVVLLATVAAGYALFTPQRADKTAMDALWAFLFVENWHLANVGTDYFRMSDAVSPVQQYWSLSVEEQYYLVWPLLLIGLAGVSAWLFANRYRLPTAWGLKSVGNVSALRRRVVGVVLALIIVMSLSWAWWQTGNEPTVAYFSTFTRAWELAAGALLAVVAHSRPVRSTPGLRALIVVAGLVIIFGAAAMIHEGGGFPAPWAAAPVLGTLLVLRYGMGAANSGAAGVGPRLLEHGSMQYVGKISYSLYLWHFPVMVFLFSMVAPSVISVVAGIALSVALAAASFVLIEDPVRRSQWLTRRSDRVPTAVPAHLEPRRTAAAVGRVARVSALWLLAVGIAGATFSGLYPRAVTAGTNYVAERLGPDPSTPVRIISPPQESATAAASGEGFDPYAALKVAQKHALGATTFPNFTLEPGWNQLDASTAVPECVQGPERSAICEFTEPGATKTAMLLGDSQLQGWLPAIREALAGTGYSIKAYVLPGCTTASVPTNYLFTGVEFEYCDTFRANALAEIEQARPDLTLITSLMESYQVQTANPAGPAADVSWQAGLAITLRRLANVSDRAVLLDSPPLGNPISECQTRFSTPRDCVSYVGGMYQHVAGLNGAAAHQVSAEGLPAVHVPVQDWFCDNGACPSFVGLNPTYSDRLHVSPAYGKFVSPLLRRALVG